MAADPGGYQAYYDYVMAAAGANDEWVSSAVMSALSHAKGRDSIDVLLSHATDNRGLVADAAMTALNFRMTTAEFDPSMSGDFEYMKSKLPGLCRNHYAASIKQYCNP